MKISEILETQSDITFEIKLKQNSKDIRIAIFMCTKIRQGQLNKNDVVSRGKDRGNIQSELLTQKSFYDQFRVFIFRQ